MEAKLDSAGAVRYRMALVMPKLVFIDRNFAGTVYPLTIEKTTVGRGDDNVLVIRDHSLSARHCEILVNGPEVIVRDLGSRNGTVVDGRLLKNQQSPVKSGQIVRFGLVDARVEIEHVAWSDETTPESAVFDHRQALREQQRAQSQPKPPNPSVKLDAPAASGASEPKTILVPNAAPIGQVPAANRPAEPVPQGRNLTWLWLAIVAIGLLVAAWWIWGRR
jgi:predicted component of type VI protein secretion system